MIPLRRMKKTTLKPLCPGNVALLRHTQCPHRRHQNLTPPHIFPLLPVTVTLTLIPHPNTPHRPLLIPPRTNHRTPKPHPPHHIILLRYPLEVPLYLRLHGIHLRPIRVQREGVTVEVGGDVTAAAGVGVCGPGAADGVCLFKYLVVCEVVLALELDGEGEAGGASADYEDWHIEVVGGVEGWGVRHRTLGWVLVVVVVVVRGQRDVSGLYWWVDYCCGAVECQLFKLDSCCGSSSSVVAI